MPGAPMSTYNTHPPTSSCYMRSVPSHVSSISYARPQISHVSTSRSSNVVPSLTSSSYTLSSGSSAPTSRASELIRARLLESDSDEEGALNLPTRQFRDDLEYLCIFEILDCHKKFDDMRTWATHVQSHFHGHKPPSNASCCLCERTFSDGERITAWSQYLHHIATFHFRQGQDLSTARPDFHLIRWMYNKGVVGKRVVSRIQLLSSPPDRQAASSSQSSAHAGLRTEPVVANAGRRNEERARYGNRGVRRER